MIAIAIVLATSIMIIIIELNGVVLVAVGIFVTSSWNCIGNGNSHTPITNSVG